MTGAGVFWAAGAFGLALLILLRRPLALVGRLLVRSGVWLGVLWVLSRAGSFLGIKVGVNLVSALLLGVLGAPGLGLLLMTLWALR